MGITYHSGLQPVRTPTTPSDFATSLGHAPVLASCGDDWRELSVQRFDVPSFQLSLDGSLMHRVTLHLGGSVLIKRKRDGRWDSRWSHPQCSSVVPAGVPVEREFENRANFVVIFLERHVVSEVASDLFEVADDKVGLAESFALGDPTLDRLGRLILAEVEEAGSGTRLYLENLSRALAVRLLRGYRGKAPDHALIGSLAPRQLRIAIEYMREHLSQDVSVRQLAAAVGLSPSHLSRAFRAATGLPPHRYLVRLRVENACRLLEGSGLSVTEIGHRSGFEQAAHFATAFRKFSGVTPRRYRQEHKRRQRFDAIEVAGETSDR